MTDRQTVSEVTQGLSEEESLKRAQEVAATEVPKRTKKLTPEETRARGVAEIDAIEPMDTTPGNFRFASSRLVLTYRTQIDKDLLCMHIRDMCKLEPEFIRVAHESADEASPYLHCHVLIHFGKTFQTRNPRIFDYEEIHPHWKKIVTNKHWSNAKNYLAKEDKDNEDLLEEPSWFKMVQNCKDINEAALLAKKPTDLNGILQAYQMRKAEEVVLPNLKGWQIEVYQEAMKVCGSVVILEDDEPDTTFVPGKWEDGNWVRASGRLAEFKTGSDRIINWIYEPKGKSGKTVLFKYLGIKHPETFLCLQGLPQSYHLASIVQGARDRGNSVRGILINLTRSAADHKIYTSLEEVRDGAMLSQKYMGKPLLWETKYMCVFSNWMPKIDAVTIDRWRFWSIEDDGFRGFIPLNDARKLAQQEFFAKVPTSTGFGLTPFSGAFS